MEYSIKIQAVTALEDWKLSVLFVNGVQKIYDVSPLFEEYPEIFGQLQQNSAVFPHVSVDCGGCGISWNEDIDLSECELWENGVESVSL